MNRESPESPDVINFEQYVALRHKPVQCRHSHVEVDPTNREVTCHDCGKVVDPFDVLVQFAQDGSSLQYTYTTLQKEVERLRRWNPFLRAVKKLEEIWRGSMLPTCPHCRHGIRAEDLAGSGRINKEFAMARGVAHEKGVPVLADAENRSGTPRKPV
ncbi:MAG: hypothetical protein M0Z68_05575 [Gammaproteobacteria bacterium]|nr:hypothetical protein [Gammaproteobacteria bacterium]